LIYSDDFESGDLSGWSSSRTGGGDLHVSAAAAIFGNYGMEVLINGNGPIFVERDHIAPESRYRVHFYLDPNSIGMDDGDSLAVFRGYSSNSTPLVIYLSATSGGYQLQLVVIDDGGNLLWSDLVQLGDGPQQIDLDWAAGTAPGANDGSVTFEVNGEPALLLVSLDNDGHRLDEVRLGAVGGIDGGTRGSFYIDHFESFR
jgi:hypothetical protein